MNRDEINEALDIACELLGRSGRIRDKRAVVVVSGRVEGLTYAACGELLEPLRGSCFNKMAGKPVTASRSRDIMNYAMRRLRGMNASIAKTIGEAAL